MACAMTASAQGRNRCVMLLDPLPRASLVQARDSIDGVTSLWISGGLRARCEGTTMVVTADSAVYLGRARLLVLVGNATYQEDGTTLTSDVMRYFEQDARLEADGNAELRSASGTTLTALQLIHFRELVGVREAASLALGRPSAILRDSANTPDSLATRVDADRMYAQGDSSLYAGGDVVITRPDLVARSDSAEARKLTETLVLLGGRPSMEASGERPFTLRGEFIDVIGAERRVERVLSRGDAVAISDSLTLSSDTILVDFAEGQLERVRTWGPVPSHAVTGGRDITADSIDIKLPGQRIEELWAIGRARAETAADTTILSTEPDWLAGDTVRAVFEAPPGPDSLTANPVLQVLEARGHARSFYQIPSRDAGDRRPAINYVLGARIDVAFSGGEVTVVYVSKDAQGVYLEPGKIEPTPTRTPARGVRR
jgi:hypothetical protein